MGACINAHSVALLIHGNAIQRIFLGALCHGNAIYLLVIALYLSAMSPRTAAATFTQSHFSPLGTGA
jgi:hypothetical protein